ncbi:hypothetical protein [Streptomyces sp. NBC_01361]|uniref:hypothetical protein n=1 Tax=Streptomyces sp. NBC_01361 TaxID=2903838 RepID=UPI002E30B84C|nr:hypothetical protein [Streptomyces sp. NBC_01361]
MGSLRNPIGPLPSTIYWRRRAVLLSMVALLALLIVWAVNSGGGGGRNSAGGSNGKNTAPSSITPGPSGSGPAISEHPGGRDESGGGGGGDGGSSDGDNGDGSGSDTAGSGAGSDDDAKGGTGAGDRLPAGSSLPDCTTGGVTLTLRSVHNSYAPGEKPEFELTAKNTTAKDCKVDLGPKNAILTITQASNDDEIWSSGDCPKGSGSLLLRVPAGAHITHTIEWDRKASAPQCATPTAGPATPGTYLVEAKAAQLPKAQASFVLAKD